MISEETWEKFRNGEVVFKTPTKEIYDKLMVELENRGYMWGSGSKPTDRGWYWKEFTEETGISTDNDGITYCNVEYYEEKNVTTLVLTTDDFSNSPSSVDYPQPPQELISILRALATCELIEKTHGVHLNLDELYDKREEYLEKWASEFEVKL